MSCQAVALEELHSLCSAAMLLPSCRLWRPC